MRGNVLTFVQAGMLTTIQDLGRTGYEQYGVPVGGAMDRASAMLANRLVGNPVGNPVLEVTLTGPTIRFSESCDVALTGAHMSPKLNDVPCEMRRVLHIKAGDVLKFGSLLAGCRTYIAVAGSWQVKKWLGSVSACTQTEEVVTPQSLIARGSELRIDTSARQPTRYKVIDQNAGSLGVIRVIVGPEQHLIAKAVIRAFYGQTFTISNHASRMGYRMVEQLRGYDPSYQMISSGIVPGTIQLTREGQPIVLLADAQTTGGYPRLAVVITADLDKFGQLKPGDKVRFSAISIDEAQKHAVAYMRNQL